MENYYAVKMGRNPGIYLNWEDCKKQVHGFPGALFKKWKTREEAENYLHGRTDSSHDRDTPLPFSRVSSKSSTVLSFLADKKLSEEEQIELLFQEFDTDALAFVDGSFQKETKVYGYGVVFMEKGGKLSKHQGFGTEVAYAEMRNVSGEILGAKYAVELAIEKGLSSITIFHDYQGISSWAEGEWKCNKEKTVEYRDFMKEAKKKIRPKFYKVPAHSGIYFNEMADALAKEAAGVESSKQNIKNKACFTAFHHETEQAFISLYKRMILCFSHSSLISSGQIEACTSPICARSRSNIQSLLCPIPPPIVRGSFPSKSIL